MMRALVALACLLACLLPAAGGEKIEPAALEFFENRIRPLLAEHCYSCHSQKAEKLKGGLYLDTRQGLLKGGDSGPAIVPGDPETSPLIRAVRYGDKNLQMPPKTPLRSEQIADLEAWVKMGAPDPREGVNETLAAQQKRHENHWAFQPVRRPSLPETASDSWVQNEIDAFVLAGLESRDLSPSPRADKRTLIRRASLGLLGLPPSAEEVEAFVEDSSERAWEKLVDRLLASPQYGERWARHWLDVARYADTKGYVFEEERRYAYAYTYRDYVIRAFNEDLPYDRFVVEQLAADQLPLGEDKRPLAAMGFLTLGRRFLNSQPDIIDDRIDVVTRGMMGLTVQCARCHDHKYDPVPIDDYYSLYGVFASAHEPGEKPLLGTASLPRSFPEYETERKKRETELRDFRQEKIGEVRAGLRAKASEYMLLAAELEKLPDQSGFETLVKERKLHPQVARRWSNFFTERRKMEHDPIFAPWFAFAALKESGFQKTAESLAVGFYANETERPVNPLVAQAFAGEIPASLSEVGAIYKKLFAEIDTAWTEALKQDPAAARLPADEPESIRQVLYGESAPPAIPESEAPRLFDVPTGQKNRALQRKIEELDAVHPGSPPRGMVLQDNAQPHQARVFVRGNQFNPGKEVPRQFPGVAAGPNRKPFEKGGGRLELAQAIVSRDNPLTARVMVNRIWLNHFGAGLVRTPSDFGVRSDPPSHPELLDFLASWFMDQGWSLKKLHRLILLSNTYRQASDDRPGYEEKDPGNQLLWRMNRRRLEFEPFRDSILAVSGRLDPKPGGQPVDITARPFVPRRSVYAFIERQNLPGIFRTFDFASPDTTSPQRFNTTVPQQALFMINSPFLAEQARDFAQRPGWPAERPAKIAAFYRAALQRNPTGEEAALAEKFLEQQLPLPLPEPPVEIWKYGSGELDPATRALVKFQPLPHYTGKAWQGGENLPDDKLGWLSLSATGGHPGDGLKNVIVRRWQAPFDCVVKITGALEHSEKGGDGVRAQISSSREGTLGFWPVHQGKREMEIPKVAVRKGDTIDFIVDSHESIDSDSFKWAPSLRILSASGDTAGAEGWNAREEFAGPPDPFVPLDAWAKYAQVLLMSNELAFVD